MLWDVACDASSVDMRRLATEIEGQLSDGWGEGVEQIRFGPVVKCDDDGEQCRPCSSSSSSSRTGLTESDDGRYSFNLTTLGDGRAPWSSVLEVSRV